MSESDLNGTAPSSAVEERPAQEKPLGPGAQLAAQREARGWTVEQVANQLNMAPRQIQALENDNYGALPGMVIARGFLRAYAKLLKIDSTPLLALVAEQNPTPVEAIELKPALSATYTEEGLPSTKKAASSKWLLSIAFLGIVLVAATIAYQGGWLHLPAQPETNTDKQAATPETPASAVVVLPPPVMDEQTAPAAEKPASSAPTKPESAAPVAAVPAPAAQSSAPVTTPVVSTVPAVPAVPAAPQAAAPAAAATATDGKNSLVLSARQDSWVEIRDARKKVLVSHVVKAGSTESFDVAQPVVLTIGNAGGIDASLRGKPLDLKSAKNNVFRLELK